MFGSIGNITNLLKSAKDLQANMERMQEELARKRIDGDAGAGLVRAVVDGKGMLVDVKIDPKATEDVELLEDLVKSAICAAVQKAHEEMKQDLANVTGGIDLGNLGNLLSGQ